MPLVQVDYNPKKMLFALKPETFFVTSMPHASDKLRAAGVEAVFTRRSKASGKLTMGFAQVVFALHEDRWGRVDVAQMTYDKFLSQRFKGKLDHWLHSEWDGEVLDTFGRRVALSEVVGQANELQVYRGELEVDPMDSVPQGYTGWYSQRA